MVATGLVEVEIQHLTCRMISQDRMIKRLCNCMGESSSPQVTVLRSLVSTDLALAEIYCF